MSLPLPSQEFPDELRRRLSLAREQVVVGSVPLRFGYIMSILSLLGPQWKTDNDQKRGVLLERDNEVALAPVRGWQRRAWNAVLCLEKVAPLWNPYALPLHRFTRNEDDETIEGNEDVALLLGLDLPHEIQKMKREILNILPHEWLYISPPMGEDVTGYVWLEGYQDVAQNRAAHTFEAAEMIYNVVAADVFLQLDLAVSYPMDWRGEHHYVPPAEWCSIAFSIMRCNRDLDMFEYDQERLREFWLWWIDEAVPASWYLRDL